MHRVVLFYNIYFKIVPVSTQPSKLTHTSPCNNEFCIALNVSTPEAIIRRYHLTNTFNLLNCALHIVSYNLNAYYYMYLVSYSVNIFNHVSEISLGHIQNMY
jgi:hypothetical protein